MIFSCSSCHACCLLGAGTLLGVVPVLYVVVSLLKLPLSVAVDDLISADSLMAAPVALHAFTLLEPLVPHTAGTTYCR